jgi:hypothetical protein
MWLASAVVIRCPLCRNAIEFVEGTSLQEMGLHIMPRPNRPCDDRARLRTLVHREPTKQLDADARRRVMVQRHARFAFVSVALGTLARYRASLPQRESGEPWTVNCCRPVV